MKQYCTPLRACLTLYLVLLIYPLVIIASAVTPYSAPPPNTEIVSPLSVGGSPMVPNSPALSVSIMGSPVTTQPKTPVQMQTPAVSPVTQPSQRLLDLAGRVGIFLSTAKVSRGL
jgi:hypothetical protein